MKVYNSAKLDPISQPIGKFFEDVVVRSLCVVETRSINDRESGAFVLELERLNFLGCYSRVRITTVIAWRIALDLT